MMKKRPSDKEPGVDPAPGMVGVAQMLLDRGYRVLGSD